MFWKAGEDPKVQTKAKAVILTILKKMLKINTKNSKI